MEIYPILSHAPLAGVLAIITGALARAVLTSGKARMGGILAAAILLGLLIWSYSAPVNIFVWAIVFCSGIAAWAVAVMMSTNSWLLIELVTFPIWLVIVMRVI